MCSLDLCLDLNYSHWIFQGFSLFSYQGTLLLSCDNLLSLSLCFIKVNTKFCLFKNTFKKNGEGGIWTLAPVSRPIPLAGAPLRPLEYFSKGNEFLQIQLFAPWRIVYSTKYKVVCQSKKSLFFAFFRFIFLLTRCCVSSYYKALFLSSLCLFYARTIYMFPLFSKIIHIF